mgnify:CR=1 FL=1
MLADVNVIDHEHLTLHPPVLIDDLPLFSATPVQAPKQAKSSVLETKLDDIHPDDLTPKDALGLLYELKAMLPRKS